MNSPHLQETRIQWPGRRVAHMRVMVSILLICSFTCTLAVRFSKPRNSLDSRSSILDNEVLSDIDECATNVHDCSPLASCIPDHEAGGYKCECNAGFHGDGKKCVNENECRHRNACDRNAVCKDTIGSFTCSCASGFEAEANDCVDVDECAKGTSKCLPEAECLNTEGSYSCACPLGFNGDGATVCADMCANAGPAQRIDCFQDGNATEGLCEARGCCWKPHGSNPTGSLPPCYYPLPANSYTLHGTQSSRGAEGVLECGGSMRYGDGSGGGGSRPFHIGPFGSEVCPLHLSVAFETSNRLRVRITDPNNPKRWEVPKSMYPEVVPEPQEETRQYTVSYTKVPFGFAVTREATGELLFNSTPVAGRSSGLAFEEQFLSITGQVETDPLLFGLGEHVAPFRLPVGRHVVRRPRASAAGEEEEAEERRSGEEEEEVEEGADVYTMFAKDRGGVPPHSPRGGDGLYGSHPFLMQVTREHGLAHGMLLLNSNAMDVVLTKDTVSFRAIGGVLDMYFFLGPSPADVVRQYTDMIGKPLLPPYWGLGFQLCRWGYGSAKATREVVEAMRAAKMPQDVQWNDIDYMQSMMDFTLDADKFERKEMAALVADLHAHNQRYTMIIDPGIPSTPAEGEYAPLDEGKRLGIFVKNAEGAYLTGKVWPGLVHFPDFLHPSAPSFWGEQLAAFHRVVDFDGVWLDMNEPSNFCDGECAQAACEAMAADLDGQCSDTEGARLRSVYAPWKLRKRGGARLNPRNPPYLPGGQRLEEKTISMDALHALCQPGVEGAEECRKVLHYDAHNLYALAESKVTAEAMPGFRSERTQVISRGTFPGSGRLAGHWLGDNKSAWADLRASVAGMLTMGLLGIPLVGADICGFAGSATRELCIRWMQLGSLYPFSRNHNTIGAPPQEPSAWDAEAQGFMRAALERRYRLLPYLYTCFHLAHVTGVPVVRPLLMEAAPGERAEVAAVDAQFMLGSALLVTPVMHEGATNVTGTFFAARWFELESGAPLAPEPWEGRVPGRVMVQAPLGEMPVHVRGGSVVAMQRSAMTSVEGRRTPVTLLAAMDEAGRSSGELYMDDGRSVGTVEKGEYTLVRVVATGDGAAGRGNVSCDALESGYDPVVDSEVGHEVVVEEVRVLGAEGLRGGSVRAKLNGEELAAAAVHWEEASGQLRLELSKGGLAGPRQGVGSAGMHRSSSLTHRGAWVAVDSGAVVAEGDVVAWEKAVWLPSVTDKLLVEWWAV